MTLARKFAAMVAASLVGLIALPVSASSSRTISGRVVATGTHTAIDGATVTVLAHSGDRFINVVPDRRTRRDGSFSALGIDETDVIVSITAPKFDQLVCRFRLSPGGLLHGDFALQSTLGSANATGGNASCPRAPSDGGHTNTVYDIR